jgi:hypothetical protein
MKETKFSIERANRYHKSAGILLKESENEAEERLRGEKKVHG